MESNAVLYAINVYRDSDIKLKYNELFLVLMKNMFVHKST